MEMQARDRHWERRIALVILPTKEAIKELKKETAATNAILHVTC